MRRLSFSTAFVAALVLAGCGVDGQKRGYQVFPNMVDSVSYKAYDPNAATRTRQTLLVPPEGAVPVEQVPFAYGASPEEAKRAGSTLKNPLAATPENLARGKKVFDTICQVCHGLKGDGDGPIIGRFPNPPSFQAPHAKQLPDGQIYHIMSRGQGIMPSHAAQVLPDDRWRVLLYLRQLQGMTAPPGPAPAAGAPKAVADAGKVAGK